MKLNTLPLTSLNQRLKILFFVLLIGGSSFVSGQKFRSSEDLIQSARNEIDSLCSDRLGGRGYIDEGHKRAASYLEKRFREIGLEPVILSKGGEKKGYLQTFPIVINLVEDARLKINKKLLNPGADFIVHRYSGSEEVSGKVADLGYGLKDQRGSLSRKIAIIRNGWPPAIANDAEKKKAYQDRANMMDRLLAIMKLKPEGIIIIQKKLTAGFAREQFPIPIIEVKADILPKKVKTASLTVKAGVKRIISQNIIGKVKGKLYPDSALIISAHYDHLGKLGPAIFTGANDNASGTTMLLSMAEYFAKPENTFPYSLVFIGFGGEETGLIGSEYYVNKDPHVPLAKTKFILNLDLMGNGVDGIMAVGGRDYPELFENLKGLNEDFKLVPQVRARANAPNSDHYFFLKKGVPGFFIYTLGGPPHYHDVNDNPSTIVLSKYVEVRELLIRFLEEMK